MYDFDEFDEFDETALDEDNEFYEDSVDEARADLAEWRFEALVRYENQSEDWD